MTKIIIIAIAIIAVVTIIAYLFRRSKAMPPHLKQYFKNNAEYETFIKKQQQFASESKSYFAAGVKPIPADIVAVYREIGLDRIADAVEAKVRPCFHLVQQKSHSKQLRSRIGGLPDLPDSILWPKHNGKSLSFIAQLNLAEVPVGAGPDSLPTSGFLYFFYDAEQSTWGFDPKDKGSWAVLYCEDPPDKISGIDYPEDIPEHARYKNVLVELQAGTSIPDPSGMLTDFSLSDKQKYQISDIYGQFSEGRGPYHQLLGHPAPIQGDMELECQLVSYGLYCGDSTGYNDPRAKELEAGASEWQLLLQVDTDEEAGMMWGDCGRLYFWIRADDLRRRNFDGVWMILQCG